MSCGPREKTGLYASCGIPSIFLELLVFFYSKKNPCSLTKIPQKIVFFFQKLEIEGSSRKPFIF
jgi:hypothetical protein